MTRSAFKRVYHRQWPPSAMGIIPDGNRRWAGAHGVEDIVAYQRASDVLCTLLDKLILCAPSLEHIAIYVFSEKNLKRDARNISGLLEACSYAFQGGMVRLCQKHQLHARLVSTGWCLDQAKTLVGQHVFARFSDSAESLSVSTIPNAVRHLYLIAGHHAESEIIEKMPSIPKLSVASLDVPCSLDFVVRTGGASRFSGFLPLQSACAELIVLDRLFPDLAESAAADMLVEYKHRIESLGNARSEFDCH